MRVIRMALVLAALAAAEPAAAAPGELDPVFSGDGKQSTDFGRPAVAYAVALQDDGKIVLAGTTGTDVGGFTETSDFAVARYHRDGSLDGSFSGDGKLTTDIAAVDRARAVVVQPDGRIIVAGESASAPLAPALTTAIVRYNANGSLDDGTDRDSTPLDAFGVGGKATLDRAGGGTGLALQYRQIVVTAGSVVARFNPAGVLDPGFGTGGTTPTTPFAGPGPISVSAVAVQPDGRIVAAGLAVAFPPDFGVVRFNVNGPLDGTFSGNGRVTTDFGAGEIARAVAVQPDGKIVAAGFATPIPPVGPSSAALARYNPDGSLDDGGPSDTTEMDGFGTGGRVTTAGMEGRAVALQPDGRIVVAGSRTTPVAPGMALARYTRQGSLDATFSGDGIVDTERSLDAHGVVLQLDGKIVVAGVAEVRSSPGYRRPGFVVARFLGRDGSAAVIGPLRASLATVARALRGASIGGVLRRGGTRVGVTALAAGVIRGSATTRAPGGRAAAARRVTVMVGSRSFTTAGQSTLRLKLTRQGRRILKRARRARLTVSLAFVDVAGARLGSSATVTLRRR